MTQLSHEEFYALDAVVAWAEKHGPAELRQQIAIAVEWLEGVDIPEAAQVK